MKIWYKVKIKHNREMDDGMLKQVTEEYLFDAVSYTDAEKRAYEFAEESITGEFTITAITKTNIAEYVPGDDGDYYTCKVVYQSVDEDTGKLTNITTNILTNAQNAVLAHTKIVEHLKGMLVPFQIPVISITKIVEVLPFEEVEA